MSMVSVSSTVTPSRRGHKESALGLYIAVIKEMPESSEHAHKLAFKRMVLSEGYEDFVAAIIQEWQAIKYSTALRAARPPGLAEIKAAAQKQQRRKAEETALVKTAKQVMGARLMEMVAPNGKPLGDCTGAECLAFGGFYGAIGRKVGAGQVVRDVLSGADLAGAAKKERIAAR
jgi:hypothetical protein